MGERCRKMAATGSKCICLLVCSLLLACCSAQQEEGVTILETLDSRGREFVVGFMRQFGGRRDGNLTLSLTSSKATKAVVWADNFRQTRKLKPGVVETVFIPQRLIMEKGKEDKGILVTAGEEISVYGLNQLSSSTDAYLALPTDSNGKKYYVASYSSQILRTRSLFAIIGVKDKTKVRVTPAAPIEMPNGKTLPAGKTTRVRVDRLQTFLFQSKPNGDLTGTRLESNKPFALLSGHECANVPAHVTFCDHLVEQLPPISRWGKDYVTAPFSRRLAGDVFRIISSQDNTVIKINNKQSAVKDAGEYLEVSLPSNSYNYVSTTEPTLLVQYCKSTGADRQLTDPFMMIVPPVSQYASAYTISTPSAEPVNFTNYMNVIVDSNETAGLRLDNRPFVKGLEWHRVDAFSSGSLSVATLPLATGSHIVHHVSPIIQFAVMLYGYASYDSYGYPGGLRLADLLVCFPGGKAQPGDGKDNDCDGRIDEELRNYRDDDGDGVIDEDLATSPPRIRIPGNVTVPSCSAVKGPDILGRASVLSVFYLCSPVTFTFIDKLEQSGCKKRVHRMWLGTDICGNMENDTQYIIVDDQMPPTITAPSHVNATCDTLTSLADIGFAAASDDCDGSEMLETTVTDTQVGCTLIRTWKSKDSCGNLAKPVNQNISIHLDPPAVEVPADQELRCSKSSDPSTTGYLKILSAAQKACGAFIDHSVKVTYSDHDSVKSDCGVTFTRVWNVTDVCGHTSLYPQKISVFDRRTPVVKFPPNVHIPCSHLYNLSLAGEPQVTGNCSPVQVSHSDKVLSCGIERTWVIHHYCGEMVVRHVQIIRLQYELPPLGLPLNTTISCIQSLPDVPSFSDVQVTCGDVVVHIGNVHFVEMSTGNNCRRQVNRRLTIRDTCNEIVQHDYIITVVDNVRPKLQSVPPDTKATCAEALDYRFVGQPVVTDACSSGQALPKNRLKNTKLTRKWVYEDSCGNRGGRETQTINIMEEPPLIVVPPNVTVLCGESIDPDDTGYAVIQRDIPAECFQLDDEHVNGESKNNINVPSNLKTSLAYVDQSDKDACPRTVKRIWTSKTFLGHSVSEVQYIIQELQCVREGAFPGDKFDNDCDGRIDEEVKNSLDDDGDGRMDEDLAYTPPKIEISASKTITGCRVTTAPAGNPDTALDSGCKLVSLYYTDLDESNDCPRRFHRVWNITDDCGNVVRKTQMIDVRQGDPPRLTAPSNTVATCATYGDTDVTGKAVVTGGCEGLPTLTADYVDTTARCTVLRTWTVTDSCGNAAPSVVQKIAIQMAVPSVDAPDDVRLTCPNQLAPRFTGRPRAHRRPLCETGAFVPLGVVNYTDNTETLSVCRTRVRRSWQVSDVCGNFMLTTQNILVAALKSPKIAFPGDTEAFCSVIFNPDVTGRPEVIDNCSDVHVKHKDEVHSCYVKRTWMVETTCGEHRATHVQVIRLKYKPFPVLAFRDLVLSCEQQWSIPVLDQPDHRLECGGMTVTGLTVNHADVSKLNERCRQVIHRQANVSDSCGNVRMFSYTVTYEDHTAPSLVISPDQNSNITCAQALTLRKQKQKQVKVNDTCNTATVRYHDHVEGNTLRRTWQASDDCNNKGPPVTRRILLQDEDIQVKFPPDSIVPCRSSVLPTRTGFPLLVRSLSKACYSLGVKKPTIEYVDTVNGSYCPSIVTRVWKISTVFGQLIEKIQRIEKDAPLCNASKMMPADGVDNDCDDRVDEEVRDFMDNDGDGLIDEDLLVEPMVVVYPSDRNVSSCSASLAASELGTVEVSQVASKCQPVTINYDDAVFKRRCRTEIVRQWSVTDSCGNVARGTQTITVNDETGPVLSAPPTVRVSCGQLEDTSITGRPQVSDDCQNSNVSVWFQDTVSGCSFERQWFADDGCGSVSSVVQTVIPILEEGRVQVPGNKLLSCGQVPHPSITGRPLAEPRQVCSSEHILPTSVTYTDSERVVSTCRSVIKRTWFVSDECGNFSNFQQEITLKTQSEPSVTYPSDISVSCQQVQHLSKTGRANVTKGCLQTNITFSDSVGDCQVSRKWSVTDECGRLASAKSQIIRLKQTNQVEVPSKITVQCHEKVELPFDTTEQRELCGSIVLPTRYVTSSNILVLGNGCRRQVTRRLKISGNCAADEFREQTITYEDREPPRLHVPSDMEASCEVARNIDLVGAAVAQDECNNVVVNYSDSLVGNTLVRTWFAVDACGNAAAELAQRISLVELAPLVIYPSDTVLECGLPVTPDAIGRPQIDIDISPFCFTLGGSPTTVTYEDTVTGTECEQTIRRTWRIETFLGHKLTHNQTINIIPGSCQATSGEPNDGVDNDCDDRVDEEVKNLIDDDGDGRIDEDLAYVPLQILRSSGIASRTCGVLNDVNSLVPPDYTVSDGCSPVRFMHEDVPLEHNSACVKTITRKWNGFDACGNADTSEQFIEIVDHTSPTVDSVSGVEMSCGDVEGEMMSGIAYDDDCGNDDVNMTCSHTYHANYTLGDFYGCVTVRQCVVHDACGNAAPPFQQTVRLKPQSLGSFSVNFPDDVLLTCGASTDPHTTGRTVSLDYAICNSNVRAASEIHYTDTLISSNRCRDIINRQWVVKDQCGQGIKSKVQEISVLHNPTASVTFPADTTVTCSHGFDPEQTGWPIVRMNCSDIRTFYADSVSGCSILRSWNATDMCGNLVATAVQRIAVSPSYRHLSFPQALTVSCDEDAPETHPHPHNRSCHGIFINGPFLSYNVLDKRGDSCRRIVRRNITVSSSCGVLRQHTQTVNYLDRTPPSMQYLSRMNLPCSDAANLTLAGRPLANDTCSSVHVAFTDSLKKGLIHRTWSAVDYCGNRAKPHVQRIGLLDHQLFLSPLKDQIIYCNESTSPEHTGSPRITQDVSLSCQSLGVKIGVVTHKDDVEGITCPRAITRKWTAVSALTSGQIIQRIKQVPHPLRLSRPSDVVLRGCHASTDPALTGRAAVSFISDFCLPLIGPFHHTISNRSLSGCKTVLTRQWVANDSCANADSTLQTIAIEDRTPPTISAPRDVVASCSNYKNESHVGSPTAADDCSSVTTSHSDELRGCSVMRTWHARDECGNTATSKVQTIQLQLGAPDFQVPGDVNVNCGDSLDPSITGVPLVKESHICGWNSTAEVTVEHHDISNERENCEMVISRRWSATAVCGSRVTDTQTITVLHKEPSIEAPADTVVSCRFASNLSVAGEAKATSLCRSVTVSYSDSLNKSVLLRSWTAHDGCSNVSAPHPQRIILKEDPPVLLVPSNVTIACHEPLHPNMTGWPTLLLDIDDICIQLGVLATVIDYSDEKIGGDCPGTILRHWTATDFLGQTSRVDQVITLVCNKSEMIPEDGKDNDCDARVDEEVRNFIDDDGDGEIDEDLATIPVKWQPIPSVSLTSCHNKTYPRMTGRAKISTVLKRCKPVATTSTDKTTKKLCGEEIEREWVAKDSCGNVDVMTQLIMVNDRTPPSVSVPSNRIVTCSEYKNESVSGIAVVRDDCRGSVSTWFEDELRQCVVLRTWKARDECGNTVTGAVQELTLRVNPPVVRFPDDVSVTCLSLTTPQVTGEPAVDVPDLCKWIVSVAVNVTVTYTDVETELDDCTKLISRTWRVTDMCNNDVSRVQNIRVTHQAPVIKAPSNTLSTCEDVGKLDVVGKATVVQSCKMVNITHDDTLNGTTLTRIWLGKDSCGLSSSSQTQLISIQEEGPELSLPSNKTIACHEPAHPNQTGWATLERDLSPSCIRLGGSPTTVTYVNLTKGQNCPGFILREWRATSFLGLTVSANQLITLHCNLSRSVPGDGKDNDCDGKVDEEVHNFADDDGDGLVDEDVVCCPLKVAVPPPKILPSCSTPTRPKYTGRAQVSFVKKACKPWKVRRKDVTTTDSCRQTIARQWKGTDSCGSVDIKVQTIIIQDLTPPSLSAPPDRTVTCTKYKDEAIVGTAKSNDDCGGNVAVWHEDSLQGCMVRRTWKARDECNNTAKSAVQTLKLRVDLPPIVFPDDVTVTCWNSSEPSVTGQPSVGEPYLCGFNTTGVVGVYHQDTQTDLGSCHTRIARTWRVADVCGNVVKHVQHITILHRAPLIDVPLAVSSSCSDTKNLDLVGRATVVQACKSVDISYSDSLNDSVLVRKWAGVDSCGLSSALQIQLIVIDEPAPLLTVPSNVTILCHESAHPNVTGWAVLTHDVSPACFRLKGAAAVINYVDERSASVCPGFIIRTWTATNFLRSSVSATQTISLGCNHSITVPADHQDNDCDARVDEESRNYIDDDGDGLIDEDLATVPLIVSSPPPILLSAPSAFNPEDTGEVTVKTMSEGCEPVEKNYDDEVMRDVCFQNISRKWTVKDGCSNVYYSSQIITVADKTPPILFVPPDTRVSCAQYDKLDMAIARDDSNASASTSYSDELRGCVVHRRWVARDSCGNVAVSQMQNITLKIHPPRVTFPRKADISCLDSPHPVNTGKPVVVPASMCGWNVSAAITMRYVDTEGKMANCDRVIHREWRVGDVCNNRITHVQNIHVRHRASVLFPVPNITSTCKGVISEGNGRRPSLLSFCSPTSIHHSSKLKGSILQRKWTATDECGRHATSQTQTIHLREDAPTLLVAKNVTIKCHESSHPNVTGWTTIAKDLDSACFQLGGAATKVTFEDLINSVGCPGQIVRRWKATTFMGHVVVAEQIIAFGCEFSDMIPADGEDNDCDGRVDEEMRNFVDDDGDGIVDEDLATSPVRIRPPQSTSLHSCSQTTNPSLNGHPDVVDVSSACTPVETKYSDSITGTVCHKTITREWMAVDSCGNVANATQLLVVEDKTPPLLTAPDNVTVTCSEFEDAEKTGAAVSNDDCVQVSQWSKDTLHQCTVQRQWFSRDRCDNEAPSVIQSIVLRVPPPVLQLPKKATIKCSDPTVPSFTGSPTAVSSTICDWHVSAAVELRYRDLERLVNVCDRMIRRRWFASDVCGNTVSGVQIIHILHERPVLNEPTAAVASCRDVNDSNIIGHPSFNDSCRTAKLKHHDVLQGNVLLRNWTAVDLCGESSLPVIQTIALVEAPPRFVIRPNITILCGESSSPDDVGWPTLQDVREDCFKLGAARTTVSYKDDRLEPGCPGVILRQWTATSFLGHTVRANQTIRLECVKSDMSPGDREDNDCDGFVDEEVRNFGDDDGDGLIDEDLSSQQLVVTTPPSIKLRSCRNVTHPSHTGRSGVLVVSDECRPVKTAHVDETVTKDCGRIVTRLWISMDACGNVANGTQKITIEDRTPPILSIPSKTRATCSELPELEKTHGAVPSDDCNTRKSIKLSHEDKLEGCTLIRRWRADDTCGNSVVDAVQKIELEVDPPDVVVPVDVNVACTQRTHPSQLGRPVVTERHICAWKSLAATSVRYNDVLTRMANCDVTIQRRWLVSDVCGYKINKTQTIRVTHQRPAVQFPSDTTATCQQSSQVTVTGDASIGSSCSDVNISRSDRLDGSAIVRSWRATDACGNVLKHTQSIRLVETAPYLMASNITVACGANISTNNTGWPTVINDLPSACFELGGKKTVVSYSDEVSGEECPMVVLRRWKLVTFIGHFRELIQRIVVDARPCAVSDVIAADGVDNDCDGLVDEEKRNYEDDDNDGLIDEDLKTEPPQLAVPQDVQVDSCNIELSTDVVGEATVSRSSEACQPVNVTYRDSVDERRCVKNVRRVWSGVDSCGNTVNMTQEIKLVDKTPPELVVDKTITTTCKKLEADEVNVEPVVTDDCASDMESVELSYEDAYVGCALTRRWTATDACGNESPAVTVRIAIEMDPPEVTFPFDIERYCSTSDDPEMTGKPVVKTRRLCESGPEIAVSVTYEDIPVSDDTCNTVVSRQWKVSDECGNVVTHAQNVVLVKRGSPSAVFPSDTTASCNDIFRPAVTGQPTVAHNCSAVNVSYVDVVVENCSVHRHWTVLDVCGTSIASHVQTLDLHYDSNAAVPKSTITTKCGQQFPPPDPMAAQKKLRCGPLVVDPPTYSSRVIRTDGQSKCHHEVVRRVSVRDSCRVAGTYMQRVHVVDDDPPVMDIPKNVSCHCADIKRYNIVGWPTIKDNCSNSTLKYTDVLVGSKILREWVGMDECGNQATAVQVISLSEPAPVVTFPESKTIYCDEQLYPRNVGWPLVEKDLDELCFKLGGSDTQIQFTDFQSEESCPRTVTRRWTITTFMGHNLQHDQRIEMVRRRRTACPPLRTPPFGYMYPRGRTAVGTTVRFLCRRGLTLSGSVSRTCLSTFKWSGTPTSCSFISCGRPAEIKNGYVVGRDFTYGRHVVFTCDPGYHAEGRAVRYCQSNGQWTGGKFSCNTVVCPRLFCPRNGWCSTTNNTFGTAIKYRCNFGYQLSGSAIRICQADGTWSGKPVTCIRETGCGRYFPSPSGKFVSPLFPRPYGNDMYCVWRLHCNERVHVTLTLDRFNTQPSRDVVEVRDGESKDSPVMARFSGHAKPLPLTTTSCDMFVTFSTDSFVKRHGFSAHFEPTSCGGTYQEPHGVIRTPNYPQRYPRDTDCYWLVIAPKGGMRLSFVDYRLGHNDYCEIRDGVTKDSETLCHLERGSQPRSLNVSTTNVWIHFHSDGVSSDNGFRAIFSEGLSCLDILERGHSKGNGVYWVYPDTGPEPIPVYCDMLTLGGGWTLVARVSNSDAIHWTGNQSWWITKVSSDGDALSPSGHRDMINDAFWMTFGDHILLTNASTVNETLLYTTSSCLEGRPLRSILSNCSRIPTRAASECAATGSWQYGCGHSTLEMCVRSSNSSMAFMNLPCRGVQSGVRLGGGSLGTDFEVNFGDGVSAPTDYAINIWIK